MPQVSLLATLLATVLSFVLGGLWYGPLFAKTWMSLIGISEATLREGFNPAKTYGITFVLAFLMSFVFGMFLGPNPSLALGVGAGAAAGIFGWLDHCGPTISSSVVPSRSFRCSDSQVKGQRSKGRGEVLRSRYEVLRFQGKVEVRSTLSAWYLRRSAWRLTPAPKYLAFDLCHLPFDLTCTTY